MYKIGVKIEIGRYDMIFPKSRYPLSIIILILMADYPLNQLNYFFYLTSDFSKRLREDVVAYVPRLIRPEGRNSIEEGGKEIVGELLDTSC